MNTTGSVDAVLAKAEAGGVRGAELATLRRRLHQLSEQQSGLLPGDELEPLADLPSLDELPEPPAARAREVLDQLVHRQAQRRAGHEHGPVRPQVTDRGQGGQ